MAIFQSKGFHFLTIAVGCSFVPGLSPVFAQLKEFKPASLEISITDRDKKPVPGAQVELREWTSEWIATKFAGESDDNGKIVFSGVTADSYSTILIRHPDYASAMQDYSVAAGEQRSVTCKLLPPVDSWVEIRSPDGKLVVGAEISRMEISSIDSDSKTTVLCDMFPLLTGQPKSDFRSDPSGRAKLPPLPAGSSVKITAVHPDWAAATTTEIDVTPGLLTTVMLRTGTQVKVTFHGQQDVLAALKGQEIYVNTFSRDVPEGRLIHKFLIADDSIKFCLLPGQYEGFSLTVDELLITPTIPSSPSTSSFVNFETDYVERNCVVRKMREVRGRVVTDSGEPVAGATLLIGTANLFADSEGNFTPVDKYPWSICDFPETDEQGYYTAKLPDGPAQIYVQWSKYYSDPERLEFTSDGVSSIPELVVHPYPALRGIVLDDKQRPVASAVVRVVSTGESDYFLTDESGKFSIRVEQFEHDQATKKRKFESTLMAFHPHNNQAQFAVVDARDPVAFENIKLELEPRDADWVARTLNQIQKQITPEYSAEILAAFEKEHLMRRDKYAAGLPGNRAPRLEGGTWFNTDAKSLDDFRGQYVLLDFWFIGCGPCERDLPNVKLAQKLFGDQGFTVLSVHIAGQTPENVKQFADAKGMTYPLVVDSPDEEILTAYKRIGVDGFPSYLLIGPDGKIVCNDGAFDTEQQNSLSLRIHKLEAIHRAFRSEGK